MDVTFPCRTKGNRSVLLGTSSLLCIPPTWGCKEQLGSGVFLNEFCKEQLGSDTFLNEICKEQLDLDSSWFKSQGEAGLRWFLV